MYDCQHSEHSHSVTRARELEGVSAARLLWSVALNQLLTLFQVVAGVVSGSTALLSDAAHNFNDANTLLIAYIARRISSREANVNYTFGYRRAELIGALINLTVLGITGLYLVYEAVSRFFEPVEVLGGLMATAAGIALAVDVGTAWLLWSMREGSINVRAAYVHNLVDALGSLAVLAGGLAIIRTGWTWIDPVLTLLIAGYVLWQVYALLPQATRVLMQAAPRGLDVQELVREVESLDGVEGMHHVHAWELDEHRRSLEARIVIQADRALELEAIKRRIKELLISKYEIVHSTLEFEFASSESGAQATSLLCDF